MTMPEKTATMPPVHHRVKHGMRRPHNWIQLSKFFAVGGSGYIVNLFVFWIAYHQVGFHYLASAACAFVVRCSTTSGGTAIGPSARGPATRASRRRASSS